MEKGDDMRASSNNLKNVMELLTKRFGNGDCAAGKEGDMDATEGGGKGSKAEPNLSSSSNSSSSSSR